MKLLLSSIEKNSQILSRERFVEVYTTRSLAGGKPTRPRRASGGGAYVPSAPKFRIMASKTFDCYAGPDTAHVDPAHVHAELDELWEKAKKLEEFADKKIAHLVDKPTELLNGLPDLDAFIASFEWVVKKYMMLLRATAPARVLPTWQYDWKAIFKEPWIP